MKIKIPAMKLDRGTLRWFGPGQTPMSTLTEITPKGAVIFR